MNCPDYVEGDKMGRTRKICRYYLDGGCCSRPGYFLCREYAAMKLGGKIVEVKER